MFPGADEYDVDVTVAEAAVERLLSVGPGDVEAADELTFARNVFLPLTTACRYTCTYCTYFDPPGEAELMAPEDVRAVCRRGADAGCTEALFTFGDDPDDRYTAIHEQLAAWGHDSIHGYLREACEIALEEGLLPHANPGDQTREQMAAVADVNASMGTMLETTADVDAHTGSRRKTPGQRLNTIDTAGKLGVPFTTGVLVGIGETPPRSSTPQSTSALVGERFGGTCTDTSGGSAARAIATVRRIVATEGRAKPERSLGTTFWTITSWTWP